MDILLQQIIIGVLLLASVTYLVFAFVRRRRQKGCPGCAVGKMAGYRPTEPDKNTRQ